MKTFAHRRLSPTRVLTLTLAAITLSLAASVLSQSAETIDPNPVRGRYFISRFGNDAWSGQIPEPNASRTDGPFKTFARARKAHRDDTVRTRVIVRQGTYHFEEPFVLEKLDSGSSYESYPGEKVVISGGRRVENWTKGPNSIWASQIPAVRTDRWAFRQLRVGDNLEPNARHPDFDESNPVEGGWNFTEGSDQKIGAFRSPITKIQNRGDWIEWSVDIPRDGQYRVLFYYQALNRRYGFTDAGERMSIAAGANPPVKLKNLKDTTRYAWGDVATVNLTEGTHIIRWTNDEGGFLNLDAITFTDDPTWDPNRSRAPASGRIAKTVQAEVIHKHGCKEIVIPQTKTPTSKTAFKFNFGDIPATPRSPSPEFHMFPGAGAANTILYQRRADLSRRVITVEPGSNATQDITPGSRYFVSNIMEGLTSPGEWYLDLRRSTLYYWPRAADFQRLGLVAPYLDRIIHIKGDPARNGYVEDVQIKGMTFMDTTYSRHVNIFVPSDAAIWLTGARKCILEGNRFLNVGGNAIRLEQKSSDNQIVGNEIAHTGQGGVILLGDNESQPRKNIIAGNWMHHLGRVLKHVAGVYCVSGSENLVANNLFEDLPRYAISFKSLGKDSYSHGNVAEYNEIRRTCLETAGGAAIETAGPHKLDTGNVIQYNRIHDTVGLIGRPDEGFKKPYLSWGILLDSWSSGTTVRGNEVVGNAQGGLCVSGGSNNTIENNAFANGLAHQVLFRVDATARGNRLLRNILQYTLIEGDFIGAEGRWSANFLGSCDYNIFWQTEGVGYLNSATKPLTPLGNFAAWQKAGFDKNSTIQDPGFVDFTKGDFQLKAGSPAYKAINFQAIPYAKIGLKGFARAWKKD